MPFLGQNFYQMSITRFWRSVLLLSSQFHRVECFKIGFNLSFSCAVPFLSTFHQPYGTPVAAMQSCFRTDISKPNFFQKVSVKFKANPEKMPMSVQKVLCNEDSLKISNEVFGPFEPPTLFELLHACPVPSCPSLPPWLQFPQS